MVLVLLLLVPEFSEQDCFSMRLPFSISWLPMAMRGLVARDCGVFQQPKNIEVKQFCSDFSYGIKSIGRDHKVESEKIQIDFPSLFNMALAVHVSY